MNRPAIESYTADVRSFLVQHSDYLVKDNRFSCAVLNVKAIRSLNVNVSNGSLAIDVEVEPRAQQTKSHAGIFARHDGRNIKPGQTIKIKEQLQGVSSDDILLDVRLALSGISAVENCILQTD